MDNQFDVIVVGAGNGGLMAAANTSKAGLKTLVLEKHNLPGGCATSFRRGRFEFEPSLHELCSVGDEKKPNVVYNMFKDLGAKIDWRYEHKMFRVICKGADGMDVTVTAENGIEDFCDCMERAVPGCRASVRRLFDLAKKNADATAYIYATKGHPNKLKMLLQHGDFMRCASHSVEEVMDALGVPKKAQNIINTYWSYLGIPTDELLAMHFLNMLKDYVIDGAAFPAKRSHELALSLVDVITKNGSEVWFNHEVTAFLYDGAGKVIGVEANGKKLYAKEVISNVIASNVYSMSPNEKIPDRTRKLANARKLGISVATIYLGIDCTMEELGIKDYTTFITTTPNPRKQYDMRKDGSMYIVNCLNAIVPESSPKGTCTMFFTMPIFGDDIPADLTPEGYKKYKNEIAHKYISDYEKLMGIDIKSHIEEIEVATPVTFAHYLGTPQGTIYGYASTGWDNIMARTANEARDVGIEGLSFAGGHAFRGDGYSCAFVTGDTVGKRIARKLKG